MARRSKPNDLPEELQQHLTDLMANFSEELKNEDLRAKVIALIPAFHTLRDLGSSLIPKSEAFSARDRILAYLKQYPLLQQPLYWQLSTNRNAFLYWILLLRSNY